MTSTGPIFTFESCSGAMNPVLCEKDTDVHVSTFTHDAQGNHIAREVADVNDYSMTVAVLISALVILTLLSVILGVFLWNRNAWIPRKSWPLQPSGEHSCTGVPDPNAESVKCLTCKASAKTKINFFNSPKTSRKMSNREKKNEGNVQATPEAPFDTKVAPYCDVNASYAVVNKSGKRNATNTAANAHRPPTIGSDSDPHTCPSTSGLSASGSVVEYTEVVLSDFPDSVGWRSEGGEAEAVPDSPSGQGRKGMVLTTEDKRAMLMTHAGGNERLFRSRRDNDDLIAPFSRPDDFGRVDQTLSTSPFGPFSVRTTSHTTREDAQGVSREGRRGLLQPTVKIVNSTRYASSAQSSTTGSDDAYSVLNYRQQVNRAWLGLQRSRAYSHVILGDEAADSSNDPSCRGLPLRRHSSLDHYDAYPVATVMKIGAGMREADMCHVHDDDVTGEVYDVSEGVYDLARFLKLPQRPHCIDNDYDHAQPFCFPVEMPKGTAAVTSPMTQQSSWPLTSQSMPNTPSQKARTLSYRPYSYTVPHGKTLSQTFNTRAMSLTRNESEV